MALLKNFNRKAKVENETGLGTNSNLSAGSYTVNIMDSHFCQAVITMSINQPTVASQ